MPAGPHHAPSSFSTPYKPDGGDFEPDDEWKAAIRREIDQNLSTLVKEAKARQVAELEKSVVSPEDRIRLEDEYKRTMADIRKSAQETYNMELAREINQRRWMAGAPLTEGWSDILLQEQRNIMDKIKQSGTAVDNPPSLSDDPPSSQSRLPVNEAPHVQVPAQTAPPSAPQHREEREKVSPLPPSHTARRTSDAQSVVSRDRIEHASSTRRKPAPSRERAALPVNWVSTDVVDEPEEMTLRPPPSSRSNRNSIERPPPVTPDRYDKHDGHGSLGRSSGSIRSERSIPHSPPKPEVWKPSVTASDEAPSPKPMTQIGRRPSSASMRSNGSGASVRPSINETIPERADDVEAIMEGEFVQRAYENDKRKSTAREKEKRSNRRRDSRPSPVDPTLRHDEQPLSSSSMRSAGSSSATMQYAVSPSSSKPLPSQPSSSFASPDDRYHTERPPKQSYPDPRPEPRPPSRDTPFLHRELSYSVREGPPSARPGSTRSPYPDDRDYAPSYQPNSRPISTKPGFSTERDYSHAPHPPIPHKASFNYDRRDREWDREREREREREMHWEEERERNLRERDYARDREHEREREIFNDSRNYPYSSRSSTGSYPTPPSSATRHASHDYLPMGDIYDDRDREGGVPPRGYGYRSHAPPPLPPPPLQAPFDEWEHPRESSRPFPSRQPSYRRDEHERRMTVEIDAYPARYVPPPGSIPIPRHTLPSEDQGPPAWTEWAAEGGGRRLSDAHRQDTYARSPPPAEHYPRHRSGHPPHKGYHDNPQPDSPTYAAHDTRPRPRVSHRPPKYDYDDNNVASESDDMVEDDSPPSEDESSGEEEQEEDIEDEDEEEERNARLRAIEVETKNLMAERMEAEMKRKAHELEIQRLKEEEDRLEEEARRRQEEVKRKEEEMARLEEETRQREEEMRRIEEEEARREEEEARLQEEAARKEEEKKLEQERIRKEEEIKKKEQETKKKELEAKRKVEAAKKLELEANKRAEEAKRKEADLKRKEEQTRKREEKLKAEAEQTKKLQLEAKKAAEEAEEKQEKLRKLEEETKKKEEEIREREQALYLREEELKRRESEAKKKEEEARRKEEERREEERRKEDERRKEEAMKVQEEEEMRRKQEEAKREEARIQAESNMRRLEEEERRRAREEERRKQEALDDIFLNIDPKLREQQEWILQQAKYEQQAEQIRRNRAEERKRNDSFGTEAAWSSMHLPSSSPGASHGTAKSPPKPNGMPADRPATDSSSPWNTSAWSSSTTAKTPTTPSAPTNKSSTSNIPFGKPRTGSVSSGTHPTGSSPHAPSGFSESEWARRQDNFINDQQEKFRREQEKKEAERQLRSAGRPLTREEIQEVFKQHERLHARLPKLKELTWNDFPWPLARTPSGPDDITMALVGAYFQSPAWPDKDKAKTPKDRIKEHLRRWHPDRFEVNSLPRVVDSEKEKVKQGAGNVVRYLSDLLRKENENSSSVNIFGD